MPDGSGGQLVEQRIDPHRIHREMEDLGREWADAQNAANLLEKTRDSVLSDAILTLRDGDTADGKRMSWDEANHRARASDDWLNHTYATVEARHKANVCKVRYDALKAKFEAMRTAEATWRAELQNLGRL